MPFTPIPWARQSVLGRQIEADGSRLFNFYAVRSIAPEDAKVPVIIYATPGYRRWAQVDPEQFDQGGTPVTPAPGIYGLVEIDSPIYGQRLYGISAEYQFFEILGSDATYNPRSGAGSPYTVPAGKVHNFTGELAQRAAEPVHMVTDGRYILWVIERELFLWDIAANNGAGGFVTAVAPIPDVDPNSPLPDEDWTDVEWLDGYFLVAARNGQFFHSLLLLPDEDAADTALQFDQLDSAFAATDPDEIVGIRAFAKRVYVFGSKTIEQWYNAGTADFAFRKVTSFSSDVGCAARATIQANEAGLYFVGSNKIVYMAHSGGVTRLSTESVEYDLARADIAACRAFTYTEEGHLFYSLTVPLAIPDEDGDAIKNWTLDLTTGLWHERSVTVRNGTQVGVYAAATFRKRNYIGFGDTGSIYELSLDWGDHDRQAVKRRAVAPVIFVNQQRIQVFSFEADLTSRSQHELVEAGDTVHLEWKDNNERDWRGGAMNEGKALDADVARYKWNRVSRVFNSRNFALETNATRRVDVLGAYVRANVEPWY